MKRLVDLEKIKTVHHIGEREPWFRASDIEACPEVKQNQTYEDWLNETIDLIGKDFAYGCDSTIYTSNAVRGTVTKQANFIWQKLCDKDDQIIKLERKLANATRILLQMKGETDDI